jgi:uncharacterized damage-inducible protein DinB
VTGPPPMSSPDGAGALPPAGFPEPGGGTADPATLFVRYLDFYRATVLRKVASLPQEGLRRSLLPSGWTPLEMLSHLAHMERRWIVWGFLGEAVADPWGDGGGDHWQVPDDVSVEDLVALLLRTGERTTRVLTEHPLQETAATGGRFRADPPTLAWICFHVLQEYARHAGHLDVAVELAGGDLGE